MNSWSVPVRKRNLLSDTIPKPTDSTVAHRSVSAYDDVACEVEYNAKMEIMNPFSIIHKYYDPASELYRILVTHSVLVAKKAVDLAVDFQTRHPQTEIDLPFITEAAMLHDIGICRCDSPIILCTGSEPYIRHGIIGREILESEGLPRHALVCERHTGAGISKEDVLRQNLPLPVRDYLPVSIEEKIVCLADKFYSKTPHKLFREKQLSKIYEKMDKWGPEVAARFADLCRLLLPKEAIF